MFTPGSPLHRRYLALWGVLSVIAAPAPTSARAWRQLPQPPALAAQTVVCDVRGRVASNRTALPGVTVSVVLADRVVATSLTDADGSYAVRVPADTYVIKAELTGFVPRQQAATLSASSCQMVVDLTLEVATRREAVQSAAARSSFESVNVKTDRPVGGRTDGGDSGGIPSDDPAASLLPPGFSLGSQADAVTISGSAVDLDRGQMNERQDALGKGEFELGSGREGPGPPGGGGNRGDGGERHGGGDKDDDRRSGGGGPGLSGSNRVRGSASYAFGGSPLDAAPYALRGSQPNVDYLQQNVTATVGGPFRLPGLYDGTGRTTFNVSFGATRNGNIVDQYATVPSAPMRAGDFSSSSVAIVDPRTVEPFPGNAIPRNRLSPVSLALLRLLPDPNLPGDARNFRSLQTAQSTTDSVSGRISHSFRDSSGRSGPSLTIAGGPSYRRTTADQLNVFPSLNGQTVLTAVSLPVTASWSAGRTLQNAAFTFGRVSSSTTGAFTFLEDLAGEAGITGVSGNPLDWGAPNLTFSAFTDLRDVSPSRRTDSNWHTSYSLTRPIGTHTLRFGGSYLRTASDIQSNLNPRGSFTFSGLYTGNGLDGSNGGGQDFADFLLGLPQQATRQYGEQVSLRGQQVALFAQDDWRVSSRWTLNYGLQYSLVLPFTETNDRLVNLDANADFTAVAPVPSGEVGPFTGAFPAALIAADRNNLAPRVGAAWRSSAASVVRFGYGITYNNGTYPTIALRLAQQPPYSYTDTVVGTASAPLALADAFSSIDSVVTNNFGIARDYALGTIQQWYGDYSRTFARTWTVGATYFGTRGSSLDLLRAPNRGPDGPRIPGVQAFIWESSEGASRMQGATFRFERRQARGLSMKASYTLARSRDNTTATSGSTTVAQDDQNLDAEWALSNFDRRHQIRGGVNLELPWGRERRWFADGGPWWAAATSDWSASANISWMSGMPLTVRCSVCATDVAQGLGGTLRADYTGQAIALANPSIDAFFNAAAFAVPSPGTFGSSARNVITGPSSFLVNAQVTRDISLPDGRSLSFGVNANNLLNTLNYGAVDTDVNSPTFGHVMSVQTMRTVRLTLRVRF